MTTSAQLLADGLDFDEIEIETGPVGAYIWATITLRDSGRGVALQIGPSSAATLGLLRDQIDDAVELIHEAYETTAGGEG